MAIDWKLWLALGAFVAGLAVADWQWRGKMVRLEKQAIQNQLDAVKVVTEEHNKLVSKLEERNRETEKRLSAVDDIHSDTVDAGDSLQQHFTDSLRKGCTPANTTSTTRELAAAATDGLVQTYVFGVVKNRAVEYAKIADVNRIRGLSCQNDYQALRLACGVRF